MAVCGIGALVSGLVVSPLVSIEKDGFNKQRFKTITGISLGTLPLWITIGVAFNWQKFQLKPEKHKTKLWKIERETS
jgi:hypothetical protein